MPSDQTAFLYPGQSLQKAGLGKDLYGKRTLVRRFFDRADDFLGFGLSRLCFQGPPEQLNNDVTCQLAIYTHSCAVTAILQDHGLSPAVIGGYSSGFYAAAYAAGCFDFLEGLRIVRRAGELLLESMQSDESRESGAMGVVFGLDPGQVADLCAATGDVHPAIFNTPRQVVISGLSRSVDALIDAALSDGALDAYRLPAATAYHSRWMQPAGRALLSELDPGRFRAPRVPLISYATLAPVTGAWDLARVLSDQLSLPVRWVDLIRHLGGMGIVKAVEVGPGRVISRSVRWIDRHMAVLPADDDPSLTAILGKA